MDEETKSLIKDLKNLLGSDDRWIKKLASLTGLSELIILAWAKGGGISTASLDKIKSALKSLKAKRALHVARQTQPDAADEGNLPTP